MDRIRLQEFMDRKGYKQQSLANALGVKRELVAAWNTGRSDVTRENIGKLLSAGMFLEEIFGEEVAAKALRKNESSNDSVNSADVRDIARQMLIDSMSQTLEKLKSDGPKPPQK
ncbi:MAG: helix-turn-helix domain-containing protein [Fibrobacter sp.]|nr:helix-turn-helix domain-containing protein [Fibrobacter sp.]